MKGQPPGKGDCEASEDGPVKKGALSKWKWLGVEKARVMVPKNRANPRGGFGEVPSALLTF